MSAVSEKQPGSIPLEHVNLLADISWILREKPVGKRALLEVFDKLSKVISFNSATLYLMNGKKDTLDEVATRGTTVNLISFLKFDQGAGLAAWAAKQKRPLYVPGRDPSGNTVKDHHDTVLLLPLILEDELIGVLCFSSEIPDAFDCSCRRFMEVVGDQVSYSLERVIHLRDLESAQERINLMKSNFENKHQDNTIHDRLNAVAELAALVNHEVNNPLATIVGSAQIIELESANLPRKLTDRVRAIVDGARKISLITHKLQKIDRIVSEQYQESSFENHNSIEGSTGENE